MAEIQLQPINGEQQVDIGGEPEVAKWWHRPYYVAAGIVLIVLVFSPLFVWAITPGAATVVSVSNDDQNNTYIVGGQPGNSPSSVSVQRNGRHRCSGTLVDHQHVLLPAQCIEKINLKTLTLQLGRKTLDEEGGETRRVTDFRVDPNWSGGRRWSYDQALLKMDRPVGYTEDIQPASLADDGSVFPAGTEAKVCGWGRVEQGKPLPKPRTLQCVNVTVTPHGLCKQIYQGKVDDNMICAGNIKGDEDACRGDAGAALMFKQGDDWIMAGQVIRGPKECGAPNSPTVYWIPSKEFITTAIEEMRDPLPPCGARPVLGPAVESAVGRIIGGQEAIPHSWPWMAHYGSFTVYLSGWRVTGATLIHESFALTIMDYEISPGDVMVFGAHSLSSTSENIQKIMVEKVYKLTWLKMALVKLYGRVKFNKHVQPICLPDAGDFPPAGTTCRIMGWGETVQGTTYPTDRLREGSATIITHEECRRLSPDDEYITDTSFCTWASGASHYDDGGPLACENDDGSWTVYGIQFIGWGAVYPTLYHNVTASVPQIKQIIAEYEASRHQV